MAETLEKDVEVPPSAEFGDVVGACAGETFEDLVDGGADFRQVKPLEVLAEGAPAGEAGVALVLWDGRRAGDGRFGSMMAAKELVAGGGAAAVTAGWQDEGAFESHDCPRSSDCGIGSASAMSSSSKKKGRRRRPLLACDLQELQHYFFSYPLLSEYQGWKIELPTFFRSVSS